MMAKVHAVDATLAKLAALRGMGGGAAVAGELAKFLTHKTNLVVARAADLAREAGINSLEPELVAAFGRFMVNPTVTDKGCGAKQAIANALYELGCDASELFLRGIRHVQKEAAWGGPVDTAAELRGLCALGLVRMGYPDVMIELVDLLGDESPQARILAARAIAYAGRDEGALLLRLKILAADKAEEVTAECLLALANLSRAKALPFIQKYLDSESPTLAEAAALALGEMRSDAALDVLLARWDRDALPALRKPLTLPIAISRLGRSIDFLVRVAAEEPDAVAEAALEAMRIYRHDETIKTRLREAVARRRTRTLDETFETLFA